jgi:hypothetical protein
MTDAPGGDLPPPPPPPPPAAGYGQPAYGQPYGAPVVGRRNGMGIAALVLGIVAILSCWTAVGGMLAGLLAVIFGLVGRGRSRRREATNGGMALTGVILGVIGLLLGVLFLVFYVKHKDDIRNYSDCMSRAQTTAQRDACTRQFRDSITGN